MPLKEGTTLEDLRAGKYTRRYAEHVDRINEQGSITNFDRAILDASPSLRQFITVPEAPADTPSRQSSGQQSFQAPTFNAPSAPGFIPPQNNPKLDSQFDGLNDLLQGVLGTFQEGLDLERQFREQELDFIRDLLPSQEVLQLQEDISIAQGERTLKALRGELPVPEHLTQAFDQAEDQLADRFRSQFGAGFDTSTPYLQALNDLTQNRELAFDEARRGELATSSQLFNSSFGQALSGLGHSNFDPTAILQGVNTAGNVFGLGLQQQSIANNYSLGLNQIASQNYLGQLQAATSVYGSQLGAQTSRYSADRSYGASTYGSTLGYLGSRYSADRSYGASTYGADRAYGASTYGSQLGALSSILGSQLGYQSSIFGSQLGYDASIYAADRQVEASRYNANSQRRSSNTAGIFGAIGSVLGSLLSDVRLKDVVAEPVGRLKNGLPIYLYKMKGTDGPYMIGLLAHQVEEVNPHAVYEDDEGFKLVDYREAVKDA